jgi:hypothetical protein
MAHKLPIIVLYLQYDTGKYPDSLALLKRRLSLLGSCRTELVVIDNRQCEKREPKEEDGCLVLPGDNSSWEFSGWNKGINLVRAMSNRFEAVLFVNDSFINNRAQNLDRLDPGMIGRAININAVCGVLNYRNRIRGRLGYLALSLDRYCIKGMEFSAWLRSNFFLIPWRALPVYGFEVLKKEDLFPGAMTPSLFLDSAPLSDSLKRRLVDYLVPSAVTDPSDVWHSRFALGPSTYQLFASKATAIVNEMYLGIQLTRAGGRVADIRLMTRPGWGQPPRDMDHQAELLFWTRAFRPEN